MNLLPAPYNPAPCPKFKEYNKERITIWCTRNKLTPPKTIKLKKDLVAWCEMKHAEIENTKVETQLKRTPNTQTLAEYHKLYEAQQAEIKAERTQTLAESKKRYKAQQAEIKAKQAQRDHPKTQAEIEWQQRLDAYLAHTMPKTYGKMKKEEGNRLWREASVPLLSLLE